MHKKSPLDRQPVRQTDRQLDSQTVRPVNKTANQTDKVIYPIPNQKSSASPRVIFPGRVYIHDETSLYIAPMNNLSVGGVFIDDLTHLDEGTEVRVVIKAEPFSTPIQVRGIVVRVESVNRYGLAVQFTYIEQETKNEIQSVVQRFHSKRVGRIENVLS